MKKYLYILIIIISGCGYTPIYTNQNVNNFEFKNITLQGDSVLNDRIMKSLNIKKNDLDIKKNDLDENLHEIKIKSEYLIIETSKNSKKNVESYRSSVIVNIIILNNGEEIKSKKFIKNFSYNTKDNKFELVRYQNQIKNNLLQEIISEIILFLNINDNKAI